jgi:hypothetical protein
VFLKGKQGQAYGLVLGSMEKDNAAMNYQLFDID